MWSLCLVLLCTLTYSSQQEHHDPDHSNVHCGAPANISHGHFKYLTHHNEDTFLTVIQYVCDAPIYHLDDLEEAVFVCTDDNHWTNHKLKLKLPECQKSACPAPSAIDHGHFEYVSTHGVNTVLAAIKYTCDDNYHERDFSDEGVYVCTIEGKWRNTDLHHEFPTCEKVECGRPIVPLEQHQRVVGGHAVHNGAMPWTVLMKSAEGEVIDGALIDHRWVLTSAHALQALNVSADRLAGSLRVYVGVEDARDLDAGHLVHAEEVHYHPRPKDAYVYRNDLALVKLKEEVKYSNHIMPVCLPAQDYASEVGRVGYVGGWGEGADHAPTRHLTYVALRLANHTACHAFYDVHHPGLLPPGAPEQFCTEQEAAGHNVCPGDHGAALVVEDGGVFYAAGVLSHDEGCASEGYAIYADVYPFREWVNKVTHPAAPGHH